MDATTGQKNNGSPAAHKPDNPCYVVVDLMSIDDPDKWIPPLGPVITPPKHIQQIIRRRRFDRQKTLDNHSDFAPKFALRDHNQSDINLRKDFFKLEHPKNAYRSRSAIVDFLRNFREEDKLGDLRYSSGWYTLQQIYNPEVFESLTELITPIENFEFYASFQDLLAYIHNNPTLFQLRPREDSVEIWSRNFCKKLVQLGENRPSTYHTVVIPMILKPVGTNEALYRLKKEWKKTSVLSCFISPRSTYGRTLTRWILPLAEPFEKDEQGVLRKPNKKIIRLDLGYLFSQRRRFGKSNSLQQKQNNQEKEDDAKFYAYRIVNRLQDKKKPGSRRHVRPNVQSKHSLAASVSQAKPSKISDTIGGQRGSIRHIDYAPNASTQTLKPKKFVLERLLRANKRKPPLERMYWIHYLRRNAPQAPNVYARLAEADVPNSRSSDQPAAQFLTTYYPIARREMYKEPEKDVTLLHGQYDPDVLRDMVKSEILGCFEEAKAVIDRSDPLVSNVQRTARRQADLLRDHIATLEAQLFNNKVVPVEQDILEKLPTANVYEREQYLRMLNKEQLIDSYVDPDGGAFEPAHKKAKRDSRTRQTVGSGNFDTVQKWSVLTNELSKKAPQIPENPSKIDDFKEQEEKNTTTTILSTREVLLDPAKTPESDKCLFVRLVIDSGYEHFYFEIGGDSEDEDDILGEMPEELKPQEIERRRRQSSLAVEALAPDTFDYLDKAELLKVEGIFDDMKGRPYREFMEEQFEKVTVELGTEPQKKDAGALHHAETVISLHPSEPLPSQLEE